MKMVRGGGGERVLSFTRGREKRVLFERFIIETVIVKDTFCVDPTNCVNLNYHVGDSDVGESVGDVDPIWMGTL